MTLPNRLLQGVRVCTCVVFIWANFRATIRESHGESSVLWIQTLELSLPALRGRKTDKEMRCQVDCVDYTLQRDYKKIEPSQRTSTPWGINIRQPNPWPPSQSLLSSSFPVLHLVVPAARRHTDVSCRAEQPTARQPSNDMMRNDQGQLSVWVWWHDSSLKHYKAA